MSLYFAETTLLFNVFYQLLLNKMIIFVIMITRPANDCHLSDIVRHQTFFSTGYATTDWASLWFDWSLHEEKLEKWSEIIAFVALTDYK
jgi:hypothetical protein